MEFSSQVKNKIGKVARMYGLDMVLAFGSTVTSKIHEESDIDLAIRYKKPALASKNLDDLHFELQGLFLGCEVDLAIINYADPLFLKKITEAPVLLFGEPQDLAKLKIYAFKRYVDHHKYFEMEKKFIQRFLAERKKKTA